MCILKKELEKIARMPMLWVFLAGCFVLNLGLIVVYRQNVIDYGYFSYVGKTARVTGNVLGDDFSERLSGLPDGVEKNRLTSETKNPTAVYADYDTGALADAYIGLYGISGMCAELLTEKYERLEASVRRLDRAGAEFSLYAAGITERVHGLLFGVVLRAVVTESCIVAVLTMLYLLSYERQNRTELLVYTTRAGRGIHKYKFFAGMLLSAGAYLLLACGTLAVYFCMFDYAHIWDAGVSSGFNRICDVVCTKPFLTWIPLTVAGYLFAVLGLGLGMVFVFAMMGAVIGFLTKNSYTGALLFFMAALAMMAAPYLFADAGIWSGYFLTQFSPVAIWLVLPWWLTDMGSVSLIPYHETAGIIFNLLFWGMAAWIAGKRVR